MSNNGGVYTYSTTAANNATADATQNWAEGQAPSSINDSARSGMASVAKYRDDISGAVLTSGTSTAFIINSNQVFDTLTDFNLKTISFRPHATNGAGPVTMTVDGFANVPLRSAPNVELPAGVLVQGTPFEAIFNQADNALYLKSFFGNPYNIPIGGGIDFWGSAPPNSNFAFPFGQAISRTAFAALFAIMGTTYGVGDGSTTFNLPDKRGRVSVALDNMGGTAANRVTTGGSGVNGDAIGSTGGAETVTQQRSDLPNISPTFSGSAGTVTVEAVGIGTGAISNIPAGGSTTAPDGANGTASGSFTPTGTVQSLNGNVTQTPMDNMPPAIVVPYILRII